MKQTAMIWGLAALSFGLFFWITFQAWRLRRAHDEISELKIQIDFMERMEAARIRESVIVKAIGDKK